MRRDLEALVEEARSDALPVERQHAAFAELVARFEEQAFRWALRIIPDPDEARDVTQDAFLTAWLQLHNLREPAAFGGWLKRLVATQCNRRLRRALATTEGDPELRAETDARLEQRERQRLLAPAISRLPETEYRVVVLFYFLGRTLTEIAGILGMARGTVGKHLHAARIAIRRSLPRSAREEFQRLRPSSRFADEVRRGLFDEYVGEYRFAERPDLEVRIAREGNELVGYGGGQRSVLASIDEGRLAAAAFDGEGRFKRDHSGRVTEFVYYEFGARLGIATRTHGPWR